MANVAGPVAKLVGANRTQSALIGSSFIIVLIQGIDILYGTGKELTHEYIESFTMLESRQRSNTSTRIGVFSQFNQLSCASWQAAITRNSAATYTASTSDLGGTAIGCMAKRRVLFIAAPLLGIIDTLVNVFLQLAVIDGLLQLTIKRDNRVVGVVDFPPHVCLDIGFHIWKPWDGVVLVGIENVTPLQGTAMRKKFNTHEVLLNLLEQEPPGSVAGSFDAASECFTMGTDSKHLPSEPSNKLEEPTVRCDGLELTMLRLQGFHMGHVVADLPLHKSSCEDKHVGKGLFTTGSFLFRKSLEIAVGVDIIVHGLGDISSFLVRRLVQSVFRAPGWEKLLQVDRRKGSLSAGLPLGGLLGDGLLGLLDLVSGLGDGLPGLLDLVSSGLGDGLPGLLDLVSSGLGDGLPGLLDLVSGLLGDGLLGLLDLVSGLLGDGLLGLLDLVSGLLGDGLLGLLDLVGGPAGIDCASRVVCFAVGCSHCDYIIRQFMKACKGGIEMLDAG